jgi:hypothetical protein
LISGNVQIKTYTNLILPVILGVINKEAELRVTEMKALRGTVGPRKQDDGAQRGALRF